MPSLGDMLNSAGETLDIDFSGAAEGFGKIVPGTYVGVITKIENKPSKAGDPYLQFFSSVDEGELKGTFLPITWAAMTGKASFRTRQILQALGFDVDDPTFKLSVPATVGRRFLCTVDRQTDQPQYMEITDWAEARDGDRSSPLGG